MIGNVRVIPSDDAPLVERARYGDRRAFRLLFEQHSPRIYRVALRMLGQEADARDLTQDVFIRAFNKLELLRDSARFGGWLLQLAMNLARDRLRQRRRFLWLPIGPPRFMDQPQTDWTLTATDPGSEARALQDELSVQIQRALDSLSPDHRAVVVLHHLEGLSLEEIAASLDIRLGTVKSRLARARSDLRQRLGRYV